MKQRREKKLDRATHGIIVLAVVIVVHIITIIIIIITTTMCTEVFYFLKGGFVCHFVNVVCRPTSSHV